MEVLEKYIIQVTGPSGSGKSYFAEKLRELGYNSIDSDKIDGLGKFVNNKGEEVEYDHYGDTDWYRNNHWVWDNNLLKGYLFDKKRLLIFGGAENESTTTEFFDYVFYLDVSEGEIMENLKNPERSNPYGKTEVQQKIAKERVREFYGNIPATWIPLKSRNSPEELIQEIESQLNRQLSK